MEEQREIIEPVRLSKLGEDRVWQPKPLEEITIVGMGATAVQYLEQCYLEGFAKKDGKEVWAMNAAAYAINCNVAWSVHDGPVMQDIWKEYADKAVYVSNVNTAWLRDLDVPLVLGEALEELPNSLEYPLHEVYAEFHDPYFNNTSAFVFAAAMLCKPKVINLYGTDFNYYGADNKSEAGKACLEYWIGRAVERGIQVNVPPQSSLMDTGSRRAFGIYGYKMQPLAKRDKAGKVIGIEQFVDPVEYRIETNTADAIWEKLQSMLVDAGSVKENRKQAMNFASMAKQVLGLGPLELYCLITGQLVVKPKDPARVPVSF